MRAGFLLLLMLMSCTASAEIYRWVDKDGNVHFGDKPGHSGAVELKVNEGLPNKAVTEFSDDSELTREEKRKRVIDAMNEDRVERNKLKEEERQQKKIKRMNCARLKDKLRSVKRATGLYNLDKDGNRVFLSHKDRNKSESSLRRAIAKHCR